MQNNLRILIVCSANSGKIAPFITEQAASVQKLGHQISVFTIRGKGLKGYLANYKRLKKEIVECKPDIIHAHYGLSALLANIQRKIPVVTTFHGSDINDKRVFYYSLVAAVLSSYNIFVSEKIRTKLKFVKKSIVIPCGVDTTFFKPVNSEEARIKLNLSKDKKYILFAGSFNQTVKNAPLAQRVVSKLDNVELIELSNFDRREVMLLLNAVDLLLMTSFSEGSPQIIKEAMACNCPVVSVDVGDVKSYFGNISQCYITSYDEEQIIDAIQNIMTNGSRSNGYESIINSGLNLESIAHRIQNVYVSVLVRDI